MPILVRVFQTAKEIVISLFPVLDLFTIVPISNPPPFSPQRLWGPSLLSIVVNFGSFEAFLIAAWQLSEEVKMQPTRISPIFPSAMPLIMDR